MDLHNKRVWRLSPCWLLFGWWVWRCWLIFVYWAHNEPRAVCDYFQFHVLQTSGWRRQRAHTETTWESHHRLKENNAAHSCPAWSSAVTTWTRDADSPGDSTGRRDAAAQLSQADTKERKPRTHLLTSKGMMMCTLNGGISGQSWSHGPPHSSVALPVVHWYRADVSLGRFAKSDWLGATSCSAWFCFLRELGIVVGFSKAQNKNISK